MPIKSAKQYRLMRAAADGSVKDGPSKEVAREFLSETGHKKRSEFARVKRSSSRRSSR